MFIMNGKRAKVCIDAGHGGRDPGAVNQEGLRESDINLAIAKEALIELERLGIESYLTREDDRFLQLYERTHLSEGAICFVSIHCNSFRATHAEGIETIYGPSGKSKALGHYIQKSLMKHLKGHIDRGPKKTGSNEYHRRLYVLLNTPCPAALVETEFISNPKQAAFLSDEKHQRRVAQAIVLGVRSFLRSLPQVEEVANVEMRRDQIKPVEDSGEKEASTTPNESLTEGPSEEASLESNKRKKRSNKNPKT